MSVPTTTTAAILAPVAVVDQLRSHPFEVEAHEYFDEKAENYMDPTQALDQRLAATISLRDCVRNCFNELTAQLKGDAAATSAAVPAAISTRQQSALMTELDDCTAVLNGDTFDGQLKAHLKARLAAEFINDGIIARLCRDERAHGSTMTAINEMTEKFEACVRGVGATLLQPYSTVVAAAPQDYEAACDAAATAILPDLKALAQTSGPFWLFSLLPDRFAALGHVAKHGETVCGGCDNHAARGAGAGDSNGNDGDDGDAHLARADAQNAILALSQPSTVDLHEAALTAIFSAAAVLAARREALAALDDIRTLLASQTAEC